MNIKIDCIVYERNNNSYKTSYYAHFSYQILWNDLPYKSKTVYARIPRPRNTLEIPTPRTPRPINTLEIP